MSLLKDLANYYLVKKKQLIKKANPFHAKDGTFTTMSNANFTSTGDKFKKAIENYKSVRAEYSNDFKNRHGISLEDYEDKPEFDKIRQRENEAKQLRFDLKKLEVLII